MGEGDDGLLRIADLELFRQDAVAELTTDLGGLETLAVVGELQSVVRRLSPACSSCARS